MIFYLPNDPFRYKWPLSPRELRGAFGSKHVACVLLWFSSDRYGSLEMADEWNLSWTRRRSRSGHKLWSVKLTTRLPPTTGGFFHSQTFRSGLGLRVGASPGIESTNDDLNGLNKSCLLLRHGTWGKDLRPGDLRYSVESRNVPVDRDKKKLLHLK